MPTYNELITRAQQVRDEVTIGGNTALRVGQLLMDIITKAQQQETDLIQYLEDDFAKLGENQDTLYWQQSPIVVLKHMEGYDDVEVTDLSSGDLFYRAQGGYWIMEKSSGGGTNGMHPLDGVLYVNTANGSLYIWDTSASDFTLLSAGGGGNFDILKNNIIIVQSNIERLYAKLGNIAFWTAQDREDAEPAPLDWGVPKQTVTLSLNLTHAVVKHNGTEKSNGSTIQAEQGSTLILTVEPASGYALTTVASSTTGATVSDNGNGTYSVSIVVGSSSMTLSITASADEVQHTITYNLTNCTATTKPTSVAQGGTATIVLQADSNYKMPSSLPSGAVTGASVTSYTVDANDNTKATLVIGNVSGDVTVTINADADLLFEKAKMYIVNSSPELFGFRTSSTNSADVNRACLTVLRGGLANPCEWYTVNATSSQKLDTEAMALYSAIPIPSGTTKVSIKCNASYYYYPGVFTAEGRRQNDNPAWVLGSTKTEFDLVNTYPNATHFAVTFKIGSAGTTAFSNETYESMGIELTFE